MWGGQVYQSKWILCLSKSYKPAQQRACLLIRELRQNAFCLSDLIKMFRISCWEIATVPFAQLQMVNWHILNLAFLWTLRFILGGSDPMLQCSYVKWHLLTGWFAVNSELVDYCPPPKATLATAQMFLIQDEASKGLKQILLAHGEFDFSYRSGEQYRWDVSLVLVTKAR